MFAADVLGISLVAEGEVLAVSLFDAIHFLVPIRLFSPVVEPCGDTQGDQNDKDHHCDDPCKNEDRSAGVWS